MKSYHWNCIKVLAVLHALCAFMEAKKG